MCYADLLLIQKNKKMKIAVLGTGMVGDTLGSKLVELGHTVKMGSRTADNEKSTCLCCETHRWKSRRRNV